MTAVRLRGKDHINRAIEAHQLNVEGATVAQLAEQYDADPDTVGRWIKTGRKHTQPPLDDTEAWLTKIVSDWGSRLDDAKDADAVRLGEALSKMLGVGVGEELAAQRVRIEATKVALVAEAFDRVIAGLPNREKLRTQFVEAMRQVEA